jgi:hypothetical protein
VLLVGSKAQQEIQQALAHWEFQQVVAVLVLTELHQLAVLVAAVLATEAITLAQVETRAVIHQSKVTQVVTLAEQTQVVAVAELQVQVVHQLQLLAVTAAQVLIHIIQLTFQHGYQLVLSVLVGLSVAVAVEHHARLLAARQEQQQAVAELVVLMATELAQQPTQAVAVAVERTAQLVVVLAALVL